MATDLQEIVATLSAFYDFYDKTVIDVGAGGGQLVDYARPARRVIAVDRDPAALAQLAARIPASEPAGKFILVESDVLDVRARGDVVLFQFSLHEIAEPERALAHARGLAPDVLVIDHAPGSAWSFQAAEDEKVVSSWGAVERATIRRQQTVEGRQTFPGYAELEAKLRSQGRTSLERIQAYRGRTSIVIPMPYRLALV